MDTLTHILSGALIGRAAAPRGAAAVSPAECALLGGLTAAFPDSDIVFSVFSPLAYLYNHRGITHSVLMLPLWGLGIAWLWSRLRRNREGFRIYALIAMLGIGLHILGDLITSFGTMIFAPLADSRHDWSTTYIIDLWFSGIILAGLAASALWRRSRVPAIVGLVVLAGYVGLQWVLRGQALEFGREYARASRLQSAEVTALPRPVSPFNWMVIVTEPVRYHYAFVNLRRERVKDVAPEAGFIARLDAPYRPLAAARWQIAEKFGAQGEDWPTGMEAWRQHEFDFFRWFAAYPLLDRIERANPSTCVWFRDLRFLTPGRDVWPFRYGMCREGDGPWKPYESGAGVASRIPL